MSSTKKKTTTIPPWTRMDCSECGCDSEATRSEPKVITGDFVCSDCKLVEQATKGVEEDVYERVAAWYESGSPMPEEHARTGGRDEVVAFIRAGLPGWSP
jgi:hypothetical protein